MPFFTQLKKRLYLILEEKRRSTSLSVTVNVILMVLILTNVIAASVETMPDLNTEYRVLLHYFRTVSVVLFTFEYALRMVACVQKPAFSHPVTGRLRFALTPLMVLDGLAILPFWFISGHWLDLRFLRISRLFKQALVFPAVRKSESVNSILHVLKIKKVDIFITVFVAFILLVLASALMYLIEGPVQPSVFKSIPHTMYWAMATLTTLGYGDVTPITPLGKLLAGVIAFLGIGIFALPAGILSSILTEEIRLMHTKDKCTHCGKKMHDTAH